MAEQPPDDLSEQLAALDVGLFVATTASTLVGLGYAKLERRDLPQAKLAIDTLTTLVPLLDPELRRDLDAAVARLQVAYADAALRSE